MSLILVILAFVLIIVGAFINPPRVSLPWLGVGILVLDLLILHLP